jgi:Flp pilus assembly protein TadG
METDLRSPVVHSGSRSGPVGSPSVQIGATATEFALVSAALLTLVIGASYIAVMTFNNMSLEWALSKASQLAKIDDAVTESDISRTVNGYLSSAGLPNAIVVYTSSISDGARTAYIAASYQRSFDLPIVPHFKITFSSNITVPLSS